MNIRDNWSCFVKVYILPDQPQSMQDHANTIEMYITSEEIRTIVEYACHLWHTRLTKNQLKLLKKNPKEANEYRKS